MHVMLDLETLATTPDAVITEIGVCFFDQFGIGRKLELLLSPTAQVEKGRRIDPITVDWWQKTDAERYSEFFLNIGELAESLDTLTRSICLEEGLAAPTIWANSPSFDCTILRDAYEMCGMRVPWSHRQERDFRTLVQLHDLNGSWPAVPHVAVLDAVSQAERVIYITEREGLKIQ